MTLVKQLEAVLRHAYLHDLSSEQWAVPTQECLANQPLETELCDLLLSSMFSLTRVSDPLLESYLTFAIHRLIPPEVYIRTLLTYASTIDRNPYQWSFLLSTLPRILDESIDADAMISALQHQRLEPWVDILSDLLCLLASMVAVGLDPAPKQSPLTSAFSFQVDSQFSMGSQFSNHEFGDSFDYDSTQRMDEKDHHEEKKNTKKWIEAENALAAADIMIQLIERGGMKRVFEVRNNLKRMVVVHEPWFTCQSKLSVAENDVLLKYPQLKRLLVLVQRLTDRDSERRMAVHMKYHELEDEGTARAMPSAGIMGFLYHMVQIRPSLEDDFVVDHLLQLQTVKGSFDESFYLELWLTALTGLREATLNTSCQGHLLEKKKKESKGCKKVVATNRLLWKSLVLVKLPLIISKLQAKKKTKKDTDKMNSIESSLRELRGFTGLLNACSQSACCAEFYAPNSKRSTLIDKIASEEEEEDEEDEDDIMKMINDMNYSTDLNNPGFIKSIRSLSNNAIYTNLVRVCEQYGFVRSHTATELLKIETDDFMDLDDERLGPLAIVDQNLDQRIESLKTNMSFVELTEWLHIGLVSSIHARKVLDFVLEILKTKADENDFHSVSKICEALLASPSSLDLIFQLYTPFDLLSPLEKFCNHWTTDSSTDIDMDDAEEGVCLFYKRFGKIWHLVVSVVKRFKLHRDLNKVFQEPDGFACQFFKRGQMVYGQDRVDEKTIEVWMDALRERTEFHQALDSTSPQDLLMITPTLVHRCLSLDEIEAVNQFHRAYLDFTHSAILSLLCQELIHGQTGPALDCLRLFVHRLSHQTGPVLSTLESLLSYRQQETPFLTKEEQEQNEAEMQQMSELIECILKKEEHQEQDQFHTETVTTGITPQTLFSKTQMMFRYIVKSGRSMFMSDVDASLLWSASMSEQTVSHYLDMVLFEIALEVGGGHWFVSMLVAEVLEAGKSGGAVRAAELGSCLISTPLYSSNRHHNSTHLLCCLLQDVLPTFLNAQENMSFFQGQTLGVFTSDCLVLMPKSPRVIQLGAYFFETLVIEGHETPKEIQPKEDGTRFGEWSQKVTESAVWRGFIKGLMSNPMVEEIWPNAFI